MARLQVIALFEETRTCTLARHLCLIIRKERAVLNSKDVQNFCTCVADLCKSFGCTEPCKLCQRASEEVMKDELQYLETCKTSCEACFLASKKKDMGLLPGGSTYVS